MRNRKRRSRLLLAAVVGLVAGLFVAVGAEAKDAAGPVTHTLEGRATCALCHGPGKVSPMPENHAGWADSTCTGCHRPASSP